MLFNIMNTILPETPKIGKSILAGDCLNGVKLPFHLGFLLEIGKRVFNTSVQYFVRVPGVSFSRLGKDALEA